MEKCKSLRSLESDEKIENILQISEKGNIMAHDLIIILYIKFFNFKVSNLTFVLKKNKICLSFKNV